MTILIIYENYNTSTNTRKTIKEYADYNEALATFHSEFAKAIDDDTVDRLSIAIADERLVISRKETWERPKPEPEPDPEIVDE